MKQYKLAIADCKNRAFRKFVSNETASGWPHKVLIKKRERVVGLPPILREDGRKLDSDEETARHILEIKFQGADKIHQLTYRNNNI